VHFDNEVHLGKMHQKVHLAKMHRLYVGIRKNHMDQIKKNKKVHLAEMHFFVLFLKVGHFAPALVIEIVYRHFFHAHRSHPPTHHNTQQHRHNSDPRRSAAVAVARLAAAAREAKEGLTPASGEETDASRRP